MTILEHRNQLVITELALTRGKRFRSQVASGGNEPNLCRSHGATDQADPETILIQANVLDHLAVGRSTSAD